MTALLRRWTSSRGSVRLLLVFAVGSIFAPAMLFAHDCAADWKRAEDCLRTPGVAQPLGAAVATVVTVLVNGAAIGSQFYPPDDGSDGGEESKPRHYSLDIRTEGDPLILSTDGEDIVWICARVLCDDPKVNVQAMTASIQFVAGGTNGDWLHDLDKPEVRGEYRAAGVRAFPPNESSELESETVTVTVSATIEGHPSSGALEIILDDFWYDLEVVEDDGAEA